MVLIATGTGHGDGELRLHGGLIEAGEGHAGVCGFELGAHDRSGMENNGNYVSPITYNSLKGS